MGTTYQPPSLASYDGNYHHAALPGYPSALAQADRQRTVLSEAQAALTTSSRASNGLVQHAHSSAQFQTRPAQPPPISVPYQVSQPTSRHSTRPSTPISSAAMLEKLGEGLARWDPSMVMHSLEIPASIAPKAGNLADLAAQLTCLIWFETVQVHEAALKIDEYPLSRRIPRLNKNAVAAPAFKKWVHGILSTTQVTQNVVFLALLFIYRLKKTNPGVKGRPGSEYRLLTVSLMLGNKFLDDNTYTNKTWGEVSGITVKEIHVMEVEFLSNMRYSLLVSRAQWNTWLDEVANFWEYSERATMPPASPLVIPSPTHRSFASPIPSPTTNLQLTPAMHPSPGPVSMYSPSATAHTNGQAWQPSSYLESASVSPLSSKPDLKNTYGKRYLHDEDAPESPAKRMSRQPQFLPSMPLQPLTNQQQPGSAMVPEPLRLPTPYLTLNTAPNVQPPVTGPYTPSSYAPSTQSAMSLPPLRPGLRAMATVFPATTGFAPQLPILTTSGPNLAPTSSLPSGATTPTGYAPAGYGTPTKRMSPAHHLASVAGGYGTSSPMAENFPHMSGVHTPISHSPSIYLQQRSSPYKPIRNFNTLLYPPPSASLQEYHLAGTAVPPNQMHYQPLGRRHDVRTGIVPDFQGLPYGGAMQRGLVLTPVHGLHLPNGRGPSGHP